MKCPCCFSEIDDEALVCKVCRRDLYLFKPLLAKIAELEEQVRGLAEHEVFKARILELEQQLEQAHERLNPPKVGAWGLALNLTLFILLPLALLLGAHAIITIVLDTNPLYLRVISIGLPLPFGFFLFKRSRHSLLPWFVGTAFLAIASVIGMSWITSLVDNTPVLPQNMFEWREYLEYAASISFSFLTGMLLGSVAQARRYRKQALANGKVVKQSSFLRSMVASALGGNLSPSQLNDIMKKLNDYGSSAVALGTTGLSIYTGLEGFIGGGS